MKPVRIKLNPDHHLTGYHPYDPVRTRRSVLKKLCTSEAAALRILRRINVLGIYTKRLPKLHAIYRADLEYVQGLRAKMKDARHNSRSKTNNKKSGN